MTVLFEQRVESQFAVGNGHAVVFFGHPYRLAQLAKADQIEPPETFAEQFHAAFRKDCVDKFRFGLRIDRTNTAFGTQFVQARKALFESLRLGADQIHFGQPNDDDRIGR